MQRFSEVGFGDLVALVEVGNGTGDAQGPVIAPGREAQALCSIVGEARARRRQRHKRAQGAGVKVTVQATVESGGLASTRCTHALRDLVARRTIGPALQVASLDAVDPDLQVDAIDQRPGEPGAIAADEVGIAGASIGAVCTVSTRAGVQGGHQHEARRKTHMAPCSGQRDPPVFEGLAQNFQGLAAEFRHLVEKQHPTVSQRHLTRSGR